MTDLQAMTVEELDAASVELKREINEIRERRREIKVVRETKVLRDHIERTVKNAGLEGIVVIPDTLSMNAETH